MKRNDWFTVDKEGLAKVLERRGVAFVVLELYQNAWDEAGTTTVEATLETIEGRRAHAKLVVQDDAPDGFSDLGHAYTLFAESYKKNDPTKRGRFDLGEKLVLALCKEATIRSTTGKVTFAKDGSRRKDKRGATEAGSIFEATIRLTKPQVEEVTEAVRLLLPPKGITTVFNGYTMPYRPPLVTFEATLPTEISGEDGVLRRSARKTEVEVVEVQPGEKPHLYEMGIPVIPIECQWHINVMQKIPLTMERDGVPPSFVRKVMAQVLNHAHDQLDADMASSPAIMDAAGHKDIDPDALNSVLDKAIGKQRVMQDPSDPEANMKAVSHGHKVVGGRQLPPDIRDRLRDFRNTGQDLCPPSGRKFPSPKPWSDSTGANIVEPLSQAQMTEGMKRVVAYSQDVCRKLLEVGVSVHIYPKMNLNSIRAAYGPMTGLEFNLKRLGRKWFNRTDREMRLDLDALLIHELGHHYTLNHLSHDYYDALCTLGAKLADLRLRGELNPADYGFDV